MKIEVLFIFLNEKFLRWCYHLIRKNIETERHRYIERDTDTKTERETEAETWIYNK